jgi:hypothetical protein
MPLILDLPIVLTATEAAGKAEVLLYLYWLERYDVSSLCHRRTCNSSQETSLR